VLENDVGVVMGFGAKWFYMSMFLQNGIDLQNHMAPKPKNTNIILTAVRTSNVILWRSS
jgi:hypothetical protein